MNGIVCIDKPVSMTSSAVVTEVRHRLGVRKAGHAGTLDPMATGLLLLAIGKDTKILSRFIKKDKTYEAVVTLGFSTDSDDVTGKVLSRADASLLTDESIRNAVRGLVGELSLSVPLYSAVKKNGIPLYKYARRGDLAHVVPPTRNMIVYKATCREIVHQGSEISVSITFEVASGVYIRSLAVELGRLLGVPATLLQLRRIRIGPFSVEDAVSVHLVSHASIRPIPNK